MILFNKSTSLLPLCFVVLGCGSTASGGVDSGADSGDGGNVSDTGTVVDGASDGSVVANDISGLYGAAPIEPVMAAYWIGLPENGAETGGGPFIYLFSGPVTCGDISKGSGWLATIPAGTQVLELLVGTTTTGAPVTAAPHAGANLVEANYATGMVAGETRATSGNVTLTSYLKDMSVDGTLDLAFPSGSAAGTFHATWCPGGREL
jgi:hypothetical protein